uniref:Uncharacterized protein n=1 Tax=Meloidogyne floridensis TaxID=298350 RepID=A0A915PAH9_9BILA
MRAIRRSLDNCYVENNALVALVETQHLEICEIIDDVDMSSNSANLKEYNKENDNNQINLSLEDEHLTLL